MLTVGNVICGTPLHLAVDARNLEAIELLFKYNPDVNIQDEYGYTPLHIAISRRQLGLAELLLNRGADVDANGISGTPLHLATGAENLEAVKLLLKYAADVNIKYAADNIYNREGNIPLHVAIERGNLEIATLLLKYGTNINDSLHEASFNDCTDIVESLLEYGADVNMEESGFMKRIPLKLADMYNKIDIIKVIANHIAKLDAAGLYVSQENLQLKSEFINNDNNYSQYFQKCTEEVKKLAKENKPLHDFLKESNINKLASTWEQNQDIQSRFDNQESLKKQYPEYANILINKANDVKKEVLLHNHLPLIVALSTHYGRNFDNMTFTGIKTFFEAPRNNFKEKLGGGGITLINFVEYKDEDVAERHAPTLKAKAFAEAVKNNTWLDNPNLEQHQAQTASQSRN